MLTREEYENLINHSHLFEIDKESSPALYKTERYNLLNLLTEYYRFYIYPKKPLDEYSLTLVETATECIKYYDKNKGDFLRLFNSSMKRDLHIAKAKEIVDEKRRGLKVANEEDKLIRKIISFARSKELDVYNDAVQNRIAESLGIERDKLRELVYMNYRAVVVSSTVKNQDGDETELFDLQANREQTIEEKLSDESAFIALIERIDDMFKTVQERQKKLLSMLLTVEIIRACEENIDKAKKVLFDKSFFNKDIAEYCEKRGELPMAKKIGETCGVSEQSLSRTYKKFKEKLK